jgi:hypothetical protein
MNVSRQFLNDFAYIADYYAWAPADVEQAKADTRASPDLVHYWTILANAHRAGYRQTPENRFIRLQEWFAQQGNLDPFNAAAAA